jgi:hypothetical protein
MAFSLLTDYFGNQALARLDLLTAFALERDGDVAPAAAVAVGDPGVYSVRARLPGIW